MVPKVLELDEGRAEVNEVGRRHATLGIRRVRWKQVRPREQLAALDLGAHRRVLACAYMLGCVEQVLVVEGGDVVGEQLAVAAA
ncbi:MAG: hypothetical protein HY904_00510 [Deltaproteobacteria bacterium]|nr:hypothetical protein [Deltaproteobacteria bacterium]